MIRAGLAAVLTVTAAGFCAATLVRLAPGFGVDERELDTRFGETARQAIQRQSGADRNISQFYGKYLARLMRGDLGNSNAFQRPVGELLTERLPVTVDAVARALVCAWTLGLGLAMWLTAARVPVVSVSATAASALLLCVPAPVLGLLFLLAARTGGDPAWPVAGAVSLAIFPRVFRYGRGILGGVASAPHVLMARARGVSPARVLAAHILAPAAPSLLAVLGTSVSIAFAAAIPIEVVCDYPGLGQLAWKAALQRDMPLLVGITLIASVIVTAANSLASIAGDTT